MGRLTRIKGILKEEFLDGFLVTDERNLRYLSGFRGGESYLVISGKKNYFITDFRYKEDAEDTLGGFEIVVAKEKRVAFAIKDVVGALGIKRLGLESRNLCYDNYLELKNALPGVELVACSNIIEKMREIKDAKEIKLIRRACDITMHALEHIKDHLEAGTSEVELSNKVDHIMRQHGAKKASFDVTAAIGPNSSKPHAIPSSRTLREGEAVLIDAGCEFEGYKSDLTRLFFLGRISRKTKELYHIVLEAQRRAISGVKPGARACDIDKLARSYIDKKGYGQYFGHALGHGIGLEVHEAPRMSGANTNQLKEGMVFTVEPAIYIPKKIGIRIEDIVLVKKGGCEVLTGDLDKSI